MSAVETASLTLYTVQKWVYNEKLVSSYFIPELGAQSTGTEVCV
jgi:hypothetical protein